MIQYKNDFSGFEKRQQIFETFRRFGFNVNNEFIESNSQKFISWIQFCQYYDEYEENLLDSPEYFIDLILRTDNDFPEELIFESRFPVLLIRTSLYLLENGYNNRNITHYIWSICILTHADSKYFSFFIENNAIQVLVMAATSTDIVCSGHAIIALSRLATESITTNEIINYLDNFLHYYTSIDMYQLSRKLILQLLTNLTISTDNDNIKDTAIRIILTAMKSMNQIEKCEAICCFSSLVQHIFDFMVDYIVIEDIFEYLKSNSTRVTDSALEIVFIIAHSDYKTDLPIKELTQALSVIFLSNNQSRIVSGIKILQSMILIWSNLIHVFQASKILSSIINIAKGSHFVVQICAVELLAELILKQENDLIEYLINEDILSVFFEVFDSSNPFLSMKIIQSVEILLQNQAVMDIVFSNSEFMDEIIQISLSEEHLCSKVAQAILLLYE